LYACHLGSIYKFSLRRLEKDKEKNHETKALDLGEVDPACAGVAATDASASTDGDVGPENFGGSHLANQLCL
jgi:hypothetical protein